MTKKTIHKFPELDRYCTRILTSLIVIGEKIRFNKLHEFLQDNGLKLTKPTLSQHLKHLTEKKMIVRRVEEAQNVSYEVDHERFRDLGKIVESVRTAKRYVDKEREAFDSESPDEQIKIVCEAMILRSLRQLKTWIELQSKPSNWEKSMELSILASPHFRFHEEWLSKKCERDPVFRGDILQRISVSIGEIEKARKRSS